jgi:D-3-phosphoglycerate dehydrogenase
MSKIETVTSGYYRVPLATVLTDSMHGEMKDFELVTVRVGDAEVAGTGVGPRNTPYLVDVWGQSLYMPFADHFAVFRYADQPGMIGRVGNAFGEHGVNIVSAAVGAEDGSDEAVMALTTDAPVPAGVVDEIAGTDGFAEGHAIDF